jgi:GntR family transcriptional regulator
VNEPTLVVEPDDPTPPYEQLRRQLAELIQSGTLKPGDRLPPLRQLAGDLGLAVGTVARTYRELEAAGLLQSRHAGGTRVAANAVKRSAAERRQLLEQHAATYARQAQLLGADQRAAIEAVRAAFVAPR